MQKSISSSTLQQLIQESSLFRGISESNLSLLGKIATSQFSPKRQILFHEEEEGTSIYLLAVGNIQLHKTNSEGREVVIRIVKPGEIFGEVILFERNTYPVTATALKDSTIISIPKDGFYNLLNENSFRNDFFKTIMKKLRYLSDRIHYLSSYELDERLRMFLKDHFGTNALIECALSKKDVAAAIGATPESLSRLLNNLKESDLVSWEQSKIKISPSYWGK